MNREIKFRAWDGSQMIYPSTNLLSGLRSCDILQRFENVMQYTGLKDNNGVEIYEGDLVQHIDWDYPFEIIFNNKKARFVCKMKTALTKSIDNEYLGVVGNIYENKELIP
jgi:hypothetical protein